MHTYKHTYKHTYIQTYIHTNIHTEVKIDNHAIQNTEQIQLLGITLDNKLSFTHHLATVSRSTSRQIGVLMRLRKLIPTEAKLHIYKSAVLPYFQHCSLVWHFRRASERRKLEKINERGLRAVFCDWRSTYGELLERAKLKTLYNMRLQDIAVFMYKVKNKLLHSTVLESFETKATQYNTLSEMQILTFRDTTVPHLENTH